jgi:two-component system chemotaxis response regulator CheY
MMKFLVVDDSKIARAKARNFIEDMGYEVVAEASDGVEAIQKYKETKADVVTIDLEMPNMKGIEASKQIKALNPDAKIVLVTSIIDKKELVHALKIGVNKVIQKPFTKNIFENSIKELFI